MGKKIKNDNPGVKVPPPIIFLGFGLWGINSLFKTFNDYRTFLACIFSSINFNWIIPWVRLYGQFL